MPQIAHIANLWSLMRHPSKEREWSLDRKIRAVAEAGFDGFTTGLTPEHKRLADKYGLKHVLGFVSSSKPEEFSGLIQKQKDAGAVQINVQLDDHDTPPALAARHWLKLVRDAEKIGGVVVSLEVHRDCCTETPEKTYEIAERFHKATGELIKLNFDFSHFAVVKHLAPANYIDRLLDHPDLVKNSDQSHMRPFNGHHCQVPATDGKGHESPEIKPYLEFINDLFACWFAGAKGGEVMYACPEFGPVSSTYGLSTFPDVWKDAIFLRGKTEALWKASLRKWQK